ncbi:protein huluwa isoform X2 [Kryptolebias marmoratus]|uniref:protein huluwa isoform X2 n=1 Tax=Kryptolebias marmoratus TaxID=37003 RepID=UPI000D53068B|nr:protein huluwa isoform X2 [Kryptolebias marmoratus]
MSQISQATASNLTEGSSVTNLTLVVLLLIPCVVVLLLLNCFFLGYKVLLLSKRISGHGRGDTEDILLRSSLPRVGDVVFSPLQDGRTPYMSLSHPVTSSRASSPRDRAGPNPRFRLLRPDGATGSGSLGTVRTASPRLQVPPSSWTRPSNKAGWWRSAPNLMQSSESESRVDLVPPNSPMELEHVGHDRRSSTYETLPDENPGAAAHPFDQLVMECEYISPSLETSCLNPSAAGSGLDSDFGASAGVSLRILSADSDGLSNGVLSSAMEWDYYDPCYVKQNNIPKHNHHRPVMHIKQYWV